MRNILPQKFLCLFTVDAFSVLRLLLWGKGDVCEPCAAALWIILSATCIKSVFLLFPVALFCSHIHCHRHQTLGEWKKSGTHGQLDHFFPHPVPPSQGDRLEMECSFSGSFGYSRPEGSEWHGMVIDTVTVIPANASSHDSLYTADTNYLPEVRSQGAGTRLACHGNRQS